MKTIQMLNPELTERFHKLSISRILLCMVFSLCVAMTLNSCNKDDYSPKVYDNSTSVREMYTENQENFSEISSLLHGSELFNYLNQIDRKSIFGPDIPKNDEYFTEEEYRQLCQFLECYRPYEIRYRGSMGYTVFVFLCKKEDVCVYYTKEEGDSLESLLYYLGQDCNVEMLQPCWYIGISPSDVVRIEK